jgi:hypothetical protein
MTPDNSLSAAGILERCEEETDPRRDLIRRVASSATFEKPTRLRAFFLYVCECALDQQPEAATEQQIGIHVYGRPPGYNPNEDNIVRSQARLLRWKLEHHFANEGKDESMFITIPKGQYLPVFESRTPTANPAPVQSQPVQAHPVKGRLGTPLRLSALAIAAVIVLAGIWLATRSTHSQGGASVAAAAPGTKAPSPPILAADGAIRIAAGSSADGYTDAWGRRWESDRYYRGGIAAPGPKELTPPVPDAVLFRTMREAVSADSKALASQLRFAYDIPVPPGSYEVRLYFASPNPQSEEAGQEDSENLHHLMIELNGQMLLWNFDPVADGVPGAMDIRAFRDVSPAADGMVHLEFLPCPERPFVSAIELIPESHGRIEPIRILAGQSGEIEIAGNRWRGDDFFIHGRTTIDQISEPVPPPPPYFARERFGNFSYAIPVPPGSYTVKLYFMESYFSPTNPGGVCKGGEGCRVFDVTSNGVALLQNFDIFKAGGGIFRPVIRTFQGLHPNGQGKILLTFSSNSNYAEVRAIEVLDEAK